MYVCMNTDRSTITGFGGGGGDGSGLRNWGRGEGLVKLELLINRLIDQSIDWFIYLLNDCFVNLLIRASIHLYIYPSSTDSIDWCWHVNNNYWLSNPSYMVSGTRDSPLSSMPGLSYLPRRGNSSTWVVLPLLTTWRHSFKCLLKFYNNIRRS